MSRELDQVVDMQVLSGEFGTGKILILEDSPEIALVYDHFCRKMNWEFDIATNGKEGMRKFLSASKPYSLYIVDLVMPELDGASFIRDLKEKDPNAIIIVQSSLDEPDKIIEVMKLGVFDYLVKPVTKEAFDRTVTLAFQYSGLRDFQADVERSNRDVLKEQLDWLTYKESIRKSDENSLSLSTIKSLNTSFSQGSGIGAILSLLDLLKMGHQTTENGALVSNEILNLLYASQDVLRKQLGSLSTVLSLAGEQAKLETISISDLVHTLTKRSETFVPFLDKKDLKIRFSSSKSKESLKIQLDWANIVFDELILNAMKYSKKSTFIDVYFGKIDGYFCIAVKNVVTSAQDLVDAENKEVLVTRPFFRLLPPVEEFSELEKFGMGLGLTAVDMIVNKHRGIFNIHNVSDHTSAVVEPCVMAEAFFPVISA
ncbi:response regulator [Leptospira licerasiae]|uniref:Response regulator receiver domain protein n=1 Tax=Leptospira licerasiae str. MMD4847 TaxID=1049971 RepID=A0ABN0H709_9LEPT|nr:response regulator [Leptospira licerasiae]EID99766.1 response regulator receiver domain protein [Leptospira licerasiae serovar Varillal str. VAR 010]EJZ41629.1 response regulator receiver domain protein [Leptospira licerasiae str. MMD4847]